LEHGTNQAHSARDVNHLLSPKSVCADSSKWDGEKVSNLRDSCNDRDIGWREDVVSGWEFLASECIAKRYHSEEA
tara:strand:- start:647 stop:871 length:225 start_codon:yes stop_codon:yes gene_type:complete